MTDEIGIVGMNGNDVVNELKEDTEIEDTYENTFLLEIASLKFNYGIFMIFKKSNYYKIPNDLKIFFGDNWILKQSELNGKINVALCGQKIYHYGSLSSAKCVDIMKKEELLNIFENIY